MRVNVVYSRVRSAKRRIYIIYRVERTNGSKIVIVVLEEYDRLNAVQSPIDDTKKNENEKHEVKKPDSILLQKLMDKDDREKSKNEPISTQDIVSSVITIN
jgi:hypothetical protein